MPEPRRLGSTDLVARIQKILDDRGITPTPETEPDTPGPNDPGHREYHRRQRIDFAMARWTAATPTRYRTATTTHPGIITWADTIATAWSQPADDNPPAPLPSLLLTGTTGTGKTHQAYGALRRIAESAPRRRYGLIATTTADMYGALRPSDTRGSTEHELRRYAEIPLLLLDDLGSAKASEWTEEVTYRVINERYNECRPTVFTSNLPTRAARPDGRPSGAPDLVSMLGDRIVSRLAEMTTVIDMTGIDRRRAAA